METLTARREINGMTKVDMEEYFDDVEVESLYNWIDRIPFSRPKKNIYKDFSDAVLVAEVVKHYFPRMVELHNYSPVQSSKHKMENWYLLNRRVLKRLDLDLSDEIIRALANGKPKVIERVLMTLRLHIDKCLEKTGRDSLWRRRELYYTNPDPVLRLQLNTPPSHPNTPPDGKSPGGGQISNRPMSPNRLSKSEGGVAQRRYNKGGIPHSHPDRTISHLNRRDLESYDPRWHRSNIKSDTARNSEAHQSIEARSYFADRPIPYTTKQLVLPPIDNIPRVLFEEKEMEVQAKEETIQILNDKIHRLEHLLHLKDARIDDLHATLQHSVGLRYPTRRR